MIQSFLRSAVGNSAAASAGTSTGFMFATGIECSAPTIRNGSVRRDLLDECGHYARWQEDLALTRDMGLRYLRYGLPYHQIHLAPGQYNWEFADLVMHEMQSAPYRSDTRPVAFWRARLAGQFSEPGISAALRRLRHSRGKALPLGTLLHAGERDLCHRPPQCQGRPVE